MADIQINTAVQAQTRDPDANRSQGSKDSNDSKTILLGVGVLVGIFIIAFAGFNMYNSSITGANVVNIDDLHQDNIEGDLNNEEGYLYNGFSFVKADGLWWTEVMKNLNGQPTLVKVPLHFSPNELEDVKYSGSISKDFNKYLDLFVVIDPETVDQYYTLALSELSFNIAKGIERNPVGACSKENPACEGREVVTCENNPNNLPMIQLELDFDVESEVILDGTCITLRGHEYGLVKAVDRLLLTWYKVME